MSTIEAVYIFDEHNNLLLDHTYANRPQPPSILLPLYLQHATPRPSLLYLPSLNPPTLLYSITQDNLLILSPSTIDTEPLLILEFLHRIADALLEFLGSPLIAQKITTAYDVVAQILSEMADAGTISQGEANALRDTVETGPGVLKNLLGSLGASGASPALLQAGGPGSSALRLGNQQSQTSAAGSAIPWRRGNVRHTSNELYVDLVESLSVTLAPSGRPLSAFAHGSIAFNCKVSGVPDLLLNLSTGGKGAGMGTKGEQLRRVMERAVFHPCVRLNRWKSDGVLSFVPPDGRFALCGYEVDLLGPDAPLTIGNGKSATSGSQLNLPATLEVNAGLGSSGADFEVRVSQPSSSSFGAAARSSAATASLQSNLGRPSAFRSASAGGGGGGGSGDSKSPALEDLAVHVPLPPSVRNISDLRPSRGEAHWSPADARVEWRIPAKEFGAGGAVLRCTVQGPLSDDDEDAGAGGGGVLNGVTSTTYDYDDDDGPHQSSTTVAVNNNNSNINGASAMSRVERNRELMPTAATLSFALKGWLASGLRVESLLVDTKKSRGLGVEVKPYKGVKYLTVSRQGMGVRC